MKNEREKIPEMTAMDENLARASLTNGVHPSRANAIDLPLVTFFTLQENPTNENVRGILNKLAKFPRFRCKVEPCVEGKVEGRLRWAFSEIEYERHVFRHDEAIELDDIERVKNELLVKVLDKEIPLFDVHVIGGEKSKSAVILAIRFSHAIGDGVHAVKVLEHVASGLNGDRVKMVHFKRSAKKKTGDDVNVILKYFCEFLKSIWLFIVGFCKAVFTAVGPQDSKTIIRDVPVVWSGKRELTSSELIALDELKTIRASFNCTVNDVVVSCVAGALQRYMGEKNCEYAKKPSTLVRAIIPYATIPKREMEKMKDDPFTLKNLFTFVSLRLSMGPCTATERLKRTIQKTSDLKRSPEAAIVIAINAIVGKLGSAVQKQTVYDYMSRHSMVLTNVPGPIERVRLAGIEVKDIEFACANLINQVSALSYAGNLRLTMVTDPGIVKEPKLITSYFIEEIKKLKIASDAIRSGPSL